MQRIVNAPKCNCGMISNIFISHCTLLQYSIYGILAFKAAFARSLVKDYSSDLTLNQFHISRNNKSRYYSFLFEGLYKKMAPF